MSKISVMVAELSQEMVVPLILNEPLAAPVPSVKLALAGVTLISMPPSLPLLEMLVVPLEPHYIATLNQIPIVI